MIFFFLNLQFQLFSFYSSTLSYLPNTKQSRNPNQNETLYQIKHTNRTHQTLITNKHWKDLNLPKPYQSFHLSNDSTYLMIQISTCCFVQDIILSYGDWQKIENKGNAKISNG